MSLTLADISYKHCLKVAPDLAPLIKMAHRFSLDDDFATFLADISIEPFNPTDPATSTAATPYRYVPERTSNRVMKFPLIRANSTVSL